MQRMRFTYTKGESIKFIGHLDVARLWERAVRRSGLPVAYTQGFNPQLRIQFASALPVGCTGQAEIADLWLNEPLAPAEFEQRLREKLPAGVEIRDAHAVDLLAPSLQSQLSASEYEIHVLLETLATTLPDEIADFLNATELIRARTRDGKLFNLRPLVDELRVVETDASGWTTLFLRVASRPSATGRPDDVLDALGLTDCARRIERARLIFAENSAPAEALDTDDFLEDA